MSSLTSFIETLCLKLLVQLYIFVANYNFLVSVYGVLSHDLFRN